MFAGEKSRDQTRGLADDEFLAEAHERFHRVLEAETDMRDRWLEELDFVDGMNHWTDQMRDERKGRPCLTFDRIGPSVDAVVNLMRQNPPEPRVMPKGSGATKDEADIIQGVIRNIEEDSSARVAYMTAYEHAVKIGRGWWRNTFDWESDHSFEQKIVTKRIANPFSVYPDTGADEFDYSDMRFAFVTEDYPKDLFEEMYQEEIDNSQEFIGPGDRLKNDWYPNNSIRVAEYWWVESKFQRIALLPNGDVVDVRAIPSSVVPVGTRRVEKRKVRGAKITGRHILERWEWLGKWIPLVPVLGRELLLREGRKRYQGMIRPAIDSNLEYDYLRSKEAEAIGLLPISQWLVAEGQIEPWESDWADANRRAWPFLRYKPVADVGGQPAPPPQRITAEPAIIGLSQAIARVEADIKQQLSTWEPTLGAPGPEESGRAIRLRQNQSDNAHYHYADNLGRSLKHDALIKLDLMPHIYSEPRAMNIYDPDGSVRAIKINQPYIEKGAERIWRLGADYNPARYDVTIGSGPNFASRRAALSDQLMQLGQAMPGPMSRAIDILVQYLDAPRELVERLRPPDIQADQEGAMPVPPQVQAQMAQQNQVVQMLTERLNALQTEMQARTVEQQTRKDIAELQSATQIMVADIKAGNDRQLQVIQQQMEAINASLDRMHEYQLAQQQMDEQKRQFDAQQQAQAEQAAQQPQPRPKGQPTQPQPAGQPEQQP